MQRATRRTLLIITAVVVSVVAYQVLRHHAIRTGNFNAEQKPLAPDFTLPQLDGQPLTLSSYRSKIVLLDFWATWCVPCREETPHFVELQKKYADLGLQIIGVSMDDSADPVRPFYQQLHINYPVVMGTAKTGEEYGGVLGLPIAFVIDRDGRMSTKILVPRIRRYSKRRSLASWERNRSQSLIEFYRVKSQPSSFILWLVQC